MSRSAFFLSGKSTAVNRSGAECVLPWLIDITFQHIQEFKRLFSKTELELLVLAHREMLLEDSWTEKNKLISRIEAYLDFKNSAMVNASIKAPLLEKLRRLEDSEAVSLCVWTRSFWQLSTEQAPMDLKAYIA